MGQFFSNFRLAVAEKKLKNSSEKVLTNSDQEHHHLTTIVSKNKDNLEFLKPIILELCKEYLKGAWKNIQLEDFVVYKPWLVICSFLSLKLEYKIVNFKWRTIKLFV